MSDYAAAIEKAMLYDEASAQGKVPPYEEVLAERAAAAAALLAAENPPPPAP